MSLFPILDAAAATSQFLMSVARSSRPSRASRACRRCPLVALPCGHGAAHGRLDRGRLVPPAQAVSSISAADRIAPIGLATFCPASGGAEPCTGSNIDVRPGCRLPDAAMPEPALQGGAEVGDDIAEQVVGDDHVELRGVLHQQHRERVDVQVPCLDVRELAPLPPGRHAARGRGPAAMALLLSAMQTAVARPRARVLERMANDPVHALAGVDLLLHRDLVLGAGLEPAADADVKRPRCSPERRRSRRPSADGPSAGTAARRAAVTGR